jgi:hypothetical protein
VLRAAASYTPVMKGNVMPAYDGRSVIWELVQAF